MTRAGIAVGGVVVALCLLPPLSWAQDPSTSKKPSKKTLAQGATSYQPPVQQWQVPNVQWLDFKEASDVLASCYLRVIPQQVPPDWVVAAQDPLPGTAVIREGSVSLQMQKPTLQLNPSRLVGNTTDAVKLKMEVQPTPPPARNLNVCTRVREPLGISDPASSPPTFRVSWQETQELEPQPADASNTYANPGVYQVRGMAVLGRYQLLDSAQITIYDGRLRLEPSSKTRKFPVNSAVGATVLLNPSPVGHDVNYKFRWSEDSPWETSSTPELPPHPYNSPGDYTITAAAMVDNQAEIPAGSARITVIPYTVTLRVMPANAATGQQVTAFVDVSPNAKVSAYNFAWGDKTLGPVDHHSYRSRGNYTVSAMVQIDGHWYESSNEQTVVVVTPLWVWLSLGGAVAVLAGSAVLIWRAVRKPRTTQPAAAPQLHVSCKITSITHTIQHPEKIRRLPSVQIRCGVAITSLTIAAPPQAQKRGAGA